MAVPHDCEQSPNKVDVDYSSEENRQKFCPYCSKAVVLVDGCNHITCHCKNEWCFLCLEPWAGDHECPDHNDPWVSFYDEDGYGEDGFHRITQLDREGFNRAGVNIEGKDRAGVSIRGFAKRDTHRNDRIVDRPQGFDDLDNFEFEQAAILAILEEVDNGVNQPTDDIDLILEQRFGFHFDQNEEDDDNDDGDHGGDGEIHDEENNDDDHDDGDDVEDLDDEIDGNDEAPDRQLEHHQAPEQLHVEEGQAGDEEIRGDDLGNGRGRGHGRGHRRGRGHGRGRGRGHHQQRARGGRGGRGGHGMPGNWGGW